MIRNRRPDRRALSLLELLVVIAIIGIVVGLTLAAVQRVRGAAARLACQNKLRQIGLAHHLYHQGHGHLPPGVATPRSRDPYPFMSWHTRLLPHLEQAAVWEEAVAAFRANPDFTRDPPHPGLARSLPVFGCPLDARTGSTQQVLGVMPRGLTSYLGVAGINTDRQDGVLFADSFVRLNDITDGTSNTLLVGERPPSADMVFGWWYAGWGQDRDGDADMLLGVRAKNRGNYASNCPPGPYNFKPGKFDNQCDAFHFWSPHTGGAHFLFADGGVRFLRYDADSIMPALSTRAGGEAVGVPD